MYEILEIMPEDGHFVALWTYDNAAWTGIFKKMNDRWFRFDEDVNGDWNDIEHPRFYIPTHNPDVKDVRYVVLSTEM